VRGWARSPVLNLIRVYLELRGVPDHGFAVKVIVPALFAIGLGQPAAMAPAATVGEHDGLQAQGFGLVADRGRGHQIIDRVPADALPLNAQLVPFLPFHGNLCRYALLSQLFLQAAGKTGASLKGWCHN